MNGILNIICIKYYEYASTNLTLKFMKKKHMIFPEFFQRLIWGPLRFFMIIFCSLQIKGVHNLRNLKSNMIIASNHQSELDPLLIVACLPFFSHFFPIIYVTKEKSFFMNKSWNKWKQILYGGAFFRMIGAYPTYVGLKNYELALPHHLETLKIGNNVGIFPTGKRIKSKEEIVKVKGGVSFLAQQSKAPIIPVLIQGLEDLNLKNIFSKKMKVSVTFGSPLYLEDIVQNLDNMIINDKLNDYEVAAAKIWKKIEKLSYHDDFKNAYNVAK